MNVSSKVIRCAKCGQNNRISLEKVRTGLQPKCGNCNAPLLLSDGPGFVDDSTFRDVVETSAIPVLVDFWAPWCGPCHMLAPVIEELAAEFSGHVRVVKLNTDESPNTSARFRIQGIPTLILFVNGKEKDRMVGVLPKRAIADRIQSLLT